MQFLNPSFPIKIHCFLSSLPRQASLAIEVTHDTASAAAMAGAGAGAVDATGAADLLSLMAEEELEESIVEAAAVEFCAGMVVGFWFKKGLSLGQWLLRLSSALGPTNSNVKLSGF